MPPYADTNNNVTDFRSWYFLPGGLAWDFLELVHPRSQYDSHWCFLAEIQHCDGFWRYRTLVKDNENEYLFVAFYLDSYEGFDWDQLERGHTLAIMHAHQHGFADGTHGVRVENMDDVHVFPVSLLDFKHLGVVLNKYSAETEGGSWKCHGCDEIKPSHQMSRCGRCKLVSYCGKDCQAKGWNDRGHKKHCKMFRDPNFMALMKLDFWEYEGPFIFHHD